MVEDSSANTVDVLANDTDADNLSGPVNAGLTVIAQRPTAATARSTIDADGLSVSYTPAADYYGTDTFTYTISDNGTTGGAGHVDTATVTITVTDVNDAPVAVNDAKTVVEDSSANTVYVLANDTDADNLSAPFNAGLTVIAKTNGSNGTVAIAADGLSVSYTPAADFYGTDTLHLHDQRQRHHRRRRPRRHGHRHDHRDRGQRHPGRSRRQHDRGRGRRGNDDRRPRQRHRGRGQ